MPEGAVWAVEAELAAEVVAAPAGEEAAAVVFAWAPEGSAFARPAGTKCRTSRESPALRKSVRNAGWR